MLATRVVIPFKGNYRSLLNLPAVCNQILRRTKTNKDGSLTTSTRTEVDTNVKPLGEKVKETAKTTSYLGIILLGVGVTGTLFYAVFNELFSSKSPNNVYSKAAKLCVNDTRVQDKLGYPIKTYGEETRRGRRRHVSHVAYTGKDGRQHLRMKFYLQGSAFTGTANLDVVENDSGKYEYRYLFVEVDDMLKNTIVIEDNRNTSPLQIGQSPSLDDWKF